MHYLNETQLLTFLLQFILILGLCRGLGILFQKMKQPTITADILVGIILGPTLIGRLFPPFHTRLFPLDVVQQTMLETLAWVGIFFLLLDTGLEVNFSSVWKQRKQSIRISALDLVVPIVVTAVPIFFLPDRYMPQAYNRIIFTLFLATIMTISALPVAIRALHDLNILKTDMGFVIVSALSINDIIGWIIFTVVLGVVTSGTISIIRILSVLGATMAFSFISLTIIRKIADRIISFIKKTFPEQSGLTITFIAILGGICGAITMKIGIHSLFGFFIAGLIAGEARDLSEKNRYVFSKMVYALFIPIFFANIGLKIDFVRSFDPLLVVFMIVVGTAGRFSAAWLGTVWAKRPNSNRVPIAIAHTPGGEMHLVVGMLALEYGLINETVYVAIVASAIFSSVILGPWLGVSIGRRVKVNFRGLVSGMLVLPALGDRNKEEALQRLCREASEKAGIDEQQLLDSVMVRERAMSTAVEEGVAFPHARMVGIKRPLLVYALSENGIEWNSPDGKPCRIIFMIITPIGEDDLQVQILGALARVMMEPQNREELLIEHDPNRIRDILSSALKPQ